MVMPGDCLLLFRGGMGMAQRVFFPPGRPETSFSLNSKPVQLPSWQEVLRLLFNLRECTAKYGADQLANCTPVLPQKETNALFQEHISWRQYRACAFNAKKEKRIAKAGQNRFMRRQETLAWFLPAFIWVYA